MKEQFMKTKMCPFFQRGHCSNGAKCSYAHTKEELRPLPDLQKTKLCESVTKGYVCRNPNCLYAHSRVDLRPSTGLVAYKTCLCFFYKKGKCLNGDKCRFAHGGVELRANVPGTPDGDDFDSGFSKLVAPDSSESSEEDCERYYNEPTVSPGSDGSPDIAKGDLVSDEETDDAFRSRTPTTATPGQSEMSPRLSLVPRVSVIACSPPHSGVTSPDSCIGAPCPGSSPQSPLMAPCLIPSACGTPIPLQFCVPQPTRIPITHAPPFQLLPPAALQQCPIPSACVTRPLLARIACLAASGMTTFAELHAAQLVQYEE